MFYFDFVDVESIFNGNLIKDILRNMLLYDLYIVWKYV